MSFYSLRITDPALDIVSDISSNCYCDEVPSLRCVYEIRKNSLSPAFPWIFCIEKTDKYLETCRTHLHFNFHSALKLKTLQAKVRSFGFSGNKDYSLKRHEEIENSCRFWGYCLKEENVIYESNFPPDIIHDMKIIAVSERQQAAKHWRKKREKAMEKTSLAERLCLDISNNPVKLTSYKDLYIFILSWYCDNNKGVNHSTISNHVHLYRLKQGILSKEDFYETFHSKQKFIF